MYDPKATCTYTAPLWYYFRGFQEIAVSSLPISDFCAKYNCQYENGPACLQPERELSQVLGEPISSNHQISGRFPWYLVWIKGVNETKTKKFINLHASCYRQSDIRVSSSSLLTCKWWAKFCRESQSNVHVVLSMFLLSDCFKGIIASTCTVPDSHRERHYRFHWTW